MRDYTHDVPKKLAALIAATLISLSLTAPVTAHAQLSSSGSSSGSSLGSAPSRPMPLQVGERDALVTLPANYDPTRAYPVLLALRRLERQPRVARRRPRARARSGRHRRLRSRCGRRLGGRALCGDQHHRGRRLRRMIVDALDAQYAIDRSSVHALGHSNGGALHPRTGLPRPRSGQRRGEHRRHVLRPRRRRLPRRRGAGPVPPRRQRRHCRPCRRHPQRRPLPAPGDRRGQLGPAQQLRLPAGRRRTPHLPRLHRRHRVDLLA
ncbi:hypothetical protein QP028_00425 [Corynebacterium suedekumii]|nr:hypothetical protein QP028_00425 [Corynebacterium suedekumii]